MRRKAAPARAAAAAAVGCGLGCALGCALGCGGAPAPRPRAHEAQVAIPEPAAPSFASPARWSYHPAAPEQALAHLKLDGGACVITADGGQRWTVSERRGASRGAPSTPNTSKESGCRGSAQAASALAPEDLVSIIRRATGSWFFVGESGALYETGTPLGPFTRTVPAPEPLAKVAGAGSVMLAATMDGKLLRWSDASGWQRVSSVAARVFDLAVTEGGRALALGLPEALLASDDGGAAWKPSPLTTVGAHRVGLTAGGELVAQGLTASIAWDPRRTPAFATSTEPLTEGPLDLDASAAAAPSAAAVMYRRAVIDADRYYEVDHRDDSEEGFALARGRLGGPLETIPLAGTTDCGSMKLGASGKQVVTACVRSAGDSIVARVQRSEDAGSTWSDPLLLETLDTDSIHIAVATTGAALITGVCRQAEATAACKPTAPLLLRPEGRRLTASAVESLGLDGPALLPAFSADGRSAYFLGHRSKDERLALFVSHDGGETFAQRPLEREGEKRADPLRDDDEEDGERASRRRPPREDGDEDRGSDSYDVNEESSLLPGEDGTVGMVLVGDGGIMYVTADEDGRVLRATRPPADEVLMAGYGQRLVALKPSDEAGTPGDTGIRVWESLDGGGTWTDIPGTRALDRDFFRASPIVVCGGGGCLFGDTVARVGWAGQVEPRADAPPPLEPVTEPAVRTPIACELSPLSRWTRIDDVYGGGEPDMDEAMRGRSAWSVLTWDSKTGAVSVVSANLPESGEGPPAVTSRSLFGRAARPAQTALDLSHQMEGYAAARVRYTTDEKGEVKLGAPMRGVEVAWENFLEGISGHATIPDAGPLELGDIKTNRPLALDSALLSVSRSGIFVRPHSPSARTSATYFIEPGSKLQRFEYPGWPTRGVSRALTFREDAALVGGQLLAVGMEPRADGPFTTVMLAHRTADAWSMTATSIAPRAGDVEGLLVHADWTYGGTKEIGVTALVADPKKNRAWATFQAFRSDGSLSPAEELPTPFHLTDPPRPCKPAERASTTRFEAPLMVRGEVAFAGTRHPVLVTDLGTPAGARSPGAARQRLVMLTWGAVLHGAPSSPCVAAWDAFTLGGGPQATAILSGDLTHSWLFRAAPAEPASAPGRRGDASSGATSGQLVRAIEYRPMTCRFDPSVKVPEAVWNAPGAVRIER